MSNTPNCTDFCTAAKCEELEARIGSLEQDLALLKASFDAHVLRRIPEAHLYYPRVKVDTHIINIDELVVDVKVDEVGDFDSVTLPELETFVTFDIFPLGNNKYEFKCQVNGDNDSDILDLGNDDILDVTVSLTSEEELQVSIQYGNQFADDSTSLPSVAKSNLKIDGSYDSDTLTITVADGESQDTAQIQVFSDTSDSSEENPHIESNLKINGYFANNDLYLTVADGESQDTATIKIFIDSEPQTIFITEEIYMNCDDISNDLRNLQNIIIAEIEESENNLNNKVEGIKNELTNNLLDLANSLLDIKDYVTVDISGTINKDHQCKFPVTEDDKPIPEYAQSIVEEAAYSGVGLLGIHENLKIVNQTLDRLHVDICKAVDPVSTLTIDDIFTYCTTDGVNRTDFSNDEQGQIDYEAAAGQYLQELLLDSKYGYLVEEAESSKLITAPNNWITPILADFASTQGRINNNLLCEAAEVEPIDVVSIVASDKVIPNASGKFLVLHFVELGNYPKRTRNSSYWQIQIPAARENYDWNNDFESLRWQRGNQYAELRFEEFKNPVSGFFADEAAANSYFDAVLNLTTATEKNRVIPLHSNPDSSVIERETRPYRGFLESVNSQGQAICHVKYVPPVDAAND